LEIGTIFATVNINNKLVSVGADVKIKTVILFFLFIATSIDAAKIKDIVSVRGVRDNQLIGYGLVVGLNGTGDGSSSKFTQRAISSMLGSVNIKIDPKDIKSKNVAAVMVTATLPPFSRHGDRIDVVVSSMGDAKSISGGTLLLTALRGVDGEITALAQGEIEEEYNGKRASLKSSAKIEGGAIVEREVGFDLYRKNSIELSLRKADFNMAVKIQNLINSRFHTNAAKAIDPRTIRLIRPANYSMVEFLAKVNELNIYGVKTNKDKIVIDRRSATVVSGADTLIEPVVVSLDDLTITIAPEVRNRASKNSVTMRYGKTTIANITRVLHKLGTKPSEIISVIRAMKRQGAIGAKLEII
jgi:flagellar P-ring protein precursor FlgI